MTKYNLNILNLLLSAGVAWGWLNGGSLNGQEIDPSEGRLSPEGVQFFESKIRPVLIRECYSCHSDQVGQVKGGLWLDTRHGTLAGGDSGAAVVPGDLDGSLLWNAINHLDYAMPPRRKLSDEVIQDFRRWIEMGAPDPRDQAESMLDISITSEEIEAGRQFWSFQKPTKRDQPVVTGDWPESPVDDWIYDRLAAAGLSPAPDADPLVLLRRLSFDLIGLPPTPQQMQRFERQWKRDPRQALERTVDQLLQSPQFGERWGRHWLDVARYAESSGRELNVTYPYAWRYRDYVIAAFNQDKPYDRFVQEQIAGDLLPVDSDEEWAENLIATGFLAIGPKTLREANRRQYEWDLADEQIDVTTRVMMGVSVACARCHDHKTDPIPQSDYYALAGIFRSMTTHYGTSDSLQNRHPSNLVILPIDRPGPHDKKLSLREIDQLKQELAVRQAELQELNRLQREQRASGNPPSEGQVQLFARRSAINASVGALRSIIDAYDDQGNPLTLAMGVQASRPVSLPVLERGELNRPGPVVSRGFPQVLCQSPPAIDNRSSGRLEFARWVGSTDNPLTARVMVNRVWQHLFGNGLVRTADDFGATGELPTHPELLDYLAVEFMEQDWSVKRLVRSIVLSRSYRMSSRWDETGFLNDPENRLLWRMEPKRLEGEAIRDAMLAISGQLEINPPVGSVVSQAGPAQVRNGRLVPQNLAPLLANNNSDSMSTGTAGSAVRQLAELRETGNLLEAVSPHRSVYLPIVRDSIPRSLEVFDFAETTIVVAKRETSSTPDQGLYFLNNTFVLQQAEEMAARLIRESNQPNERIKQAFRLAFGRPASAAELAAALEFYQQFEVDAPATPSTGRNARSSNRNNNGRLRNPIPSAAQIAEAESLKKLTAVCQAIMASAEFRFVN